jgi:hypothetical protein
MGICIPDKNTWVTFRSKEAVVAQCHTTLPIGLELFTKMRCMKNTKQNKSQKMKLGGPCATMQHSLERDIVFGSRPTVTYATTTKNLYESSSHPVVKQSLTNHKPRPLSLTKTISLSLNMSTVTTWHNGPDHK